MIKHFGQNDLYKNQFQKWAKYWPWRRNTTNTCTSCMDPNIPIRFLWATEDELCSESRMNKWVIAFPGGDLDATQYVEGDHSTASGKNDPEFMVKIRAMLKDQGADMDSAVCSAPFKWHTYLDDNLVAMGLRANFFDVEDDDDEEVAFDDDVDFADLNEEEIEAWLKANPEIRQALRREEKELTRQERKENTI